MVKDIRPQLAAYASAHLGRAIAATDPEVLELEEALQRQLFKLGGRTNPGGYYLDVIMLGLPGTNLQARLKSPNDLMRMNLEKEYRSYRNDWFRVLNHNIPFPLRPRKPLRHARVMFQVFANKSDKHLLDAEAKYSAVKPLMDCLQPNTTFAGSGRETTRLGVGLLADDTDGEHFRSGVVRQLEVLQRRSRIPKLRLVIEEVTKWKL